MNSSELELHVVDLLSEPMPLQLGFDLDRANSIFLDYIKSHKRIIYGGLAINEHLKAVNPDLAIYTATEPVADIDIYSPDPYSDAKAICDLLAKEFNYVQFIEAIHKGTFKIAIEFKYLYDLTYIPPSVFEQLPFREYSNTLVTGSSGTKIRFIAPDFMFIDIYKSFEDISNCWRWEKDYKRMSLLLDHCDPFSEGTRGTKGTRESGIATSNPITVPNGYTVTGLNAVEWYRSIVNGGRKRSGFIELYGDTSNTNKFSKLFSSKIVNTVHYNAYLNCLPDSVRLDMENGTTVWIYNSTNGKAYTTFEETLLFLFSVLQRERSVQLVPYNSLELINEMYSLFNVYNEKRTALEQDNPFRILIDTGYKFYNSVVYKMNVVNYHTKVFTMPYRPGKMSDEQRQLIKEYSYIVNDGKERSSSERSKRSSERSSSEQSERSEESNIERNTNKEESERVTNKEEEHINKMSREVSKRSKSVSKRSKNSK